MASLNASSKSRSAALGFLVLLGVVSLFADLTYEAARSITGPFLASLGAGAAAVGAVAGAGEFVGYGLRIAFGFLGDRTGRYWAITIVGYAVNLLAVPALALAGCWEVAAGLIVAERLGKAVRTPARDAMLSCAARQVGRGWGFGIHEALDQIGAIVGPLFVAVVLARRGSYAVAFAVLAIPAAIALSCLAAARVIYPQPQQLDAGTGPDGGEPLRPGFWIYTAAAACLGLGFADYALVAFHMKAAALVADRLIPVWYAAAMAVDALGALALGRLYDRYGLAVLIGVAAATAWSAPLVFPLGARFLWLGLFLWAIGMGAQESVVRAVVAELVPRERRATGYGIFNAAFGLAWFAGSALMGWLYTFSPAVLAAFSTASQLSALPFLYAVMRAARPANR